MTKQEIFDKVSNHLIKQNAVSKRNGSCAYRGEDGLMCAVGCLIPDELYEPDIEDATPHSILMHETLVKLGIDSQNIKHLLRELQLIHDSYNPEYWKERLSDFAKEHKLTTPKCILEEEPKQ